MAARTIRAGFVRPSPRAQAELRTLAASFHAVATSDERADAEEASVPAYNPPRSAVSDGRLDQHVLNGLHRSANPGHKGLSRLAAPAQTLLARSPVLGLARVAAFPRSGQTNKLFGKFAPFLIRHVADRLRWLDHGEQTPRGFLRVPHAFSRAEDTLYVRQFAAHMTRNDRRRRT
jgi:hypothetical protein